MNNIGSSTILKVGFPYSDTVIGARGPSGPTGPGGPTGGTGPIGPRGSTGIGIDFILPGVTVYLVGGQEIILTGFTGNPPTDFSTFLTENPNPYQITEATGSTPLTFNLVSVVAGLTATFKPVTSGGDLTVSVSGNNLLFTGQSSIGTIGPTGAILFSGAGGTVYPSVNDSNELVFKYEKVNSSNYGSYRGFKIFYEGGITGATLAYFDSVGAIFAPSLYQGEVKSIWGDIVTNGITISSLEAGLTTGNITSAVSALTAQGVGSSSKDYVILRFDNPWMEQLIFDGYSGPKTALEISDNQKAVDFYSSILIGGTGTDGNTFDGLKTYFPNAKFGFANIPALDNLYPAYPDPNFNDPREIWGYTLSDRNDMIDQIANTYVSYSRLMNAIDLLVPTTYPLLNSPDANEFIARHKLKICNSINSKLTPKKEILGIVSPFYWTSFSAIPYKSGSKTLYGFTFEAIPPYTVLTSTENQQQQYIPNLEEGSDGIVVWGAERGLYSSGLLGETVGIPLGSVNFNDIPINFEGITGITNGYSYKSLWRQSISAHLNYLGGSAANNRWVYEGVTYYTPSEWLPLEQNNPGSTSSVSTTTQINNLFTNIIYNQLNLGSAYITNFYITSGILGGLIQENGFVSGIKNLNNFNDGGQALNFYDKVKESVNDPSNIHINLLRRESNSEQSTFTTRELITSGFARISGSTEEKRWPPIGSFIPFSSFKAATNVLYTGTKTYGSCCYCEASPQSQNCIDYVEEQYCTSLGGIFAGNTPCSSRTESQCRNVGPCCIGENCVETTEFLCDTFGGTFRFNGSCNGTPGICD